MLSRLSALSVSWPATVRSAMLWMPALMPPLSSLKAKAPAMPPLRLLVSPALEPRFIFSAVTTAPAASATMREAAVRSATRLAELSVIEPVPGTLAEGEPTRAATGRSMRLPVPAPTRAPP